MLSSHRDWESEFGSKNIYVYILIKFFGGLILHS